MGSFPETYNDPFFFKSPYPFLLAGEAQPAKRKSDAVLHEHATTSWKRMTKIRLRRSFSLLIFL